MTVVEDVYEPLPLYRDVLRGKFRETANAFFADLVAKSGVDMQANAATVREVRAIAGELEKAESARAAWAWAIGLAIAGLVGLAIAIFGIASENGADASGALAAIGGGIVAILPLLFGVFIPKYRHSDEVVRGVRDRLDACRTVAWEQMAPLNALFDWNDVAKIIEKTVPRISFDPYFTQGRLNELHELFGWSDAFNEGKSVLGAQSGEINGNPFVFGRLLEMGWSEKTYSGTREVSWTELKRDSNGKLCTVRRYQTLTGHVYKPVPEFSQDIFLLYGNDAAPKLTFTRLPSDLSAGGKGFFAQTRLKSEIKSLERFSRNLDAQYGYTIMGNREFEALFQTRDRSDEVEYRLLFTPLAQKQMLALLQDKTVGYGDDFSFVKANKINLIRAAHLVEADLDTDPAKFADFNFETIRAKFISFCENYFKATYFALAPLLSIPLYQQTRTHAEIYKDAYGHRSSFWEHESLANYLGEPRFRHPDSVTRNILKTQVVRQDDDVTTVAVTAHGYRTERRVDVVSVRANNGCYYDVSVEWEEYLPVSQTTDVRTTERKGLSKPDFDFALRTGEDWQNFFRNWNADSAHAIFRRSIIAF